MTRMKAVICSLSCCIAASLSLRNYIYISLNCSHNYIVVTNVIAVWVMFRHNVSWSEWNTTFSFMLFWPFMALFSQDSFSVPFFHYICRTGSIGLEPRSFHFHQNKATCLKVCFKPLTRLSWSPQHHRGITAHLYLLKCLHNKSPLLFCS